MITIIDDFVTAGMIRFDFTGSPNMFLVYLRHESTLLTRHPT